tara:strand:+ start:138 stop:356 length:219 start_codon:yes stop_codon:yes gene_type:complete
MMSSNFIIKIGIIEKRLEKIDHKLDELILLTRENEKKCDKMTSHIDFINSIYEKLKAPIEFICDKFKLISNE